MDDKSKYDTNPLDPDLPRKTGQVSGSTDSVAPKMEPQTRALESEAPTRQFNVPYTPPTSYPSVFVPPQHQPPAVQGVPFAPPVNVRPLTSRNVSGISLPENVVMIVPYLPFFLGAIASVIELLLVPRHESRVRFHAAQGLALQLLVIAIQFLLRFIAEFTGGGFGRWIFFVASFIFLVVSMIRVSKGEPHHLTPLDEATKWLNEKIEPRK